MTTADLTIDHKTLDDALAARRYFAKFENIVTYMLEVTKIAQDEDLVTKLDAVIIREYLKALGNTFTALSFKHLFAGRTGRSDTRYFNIDKMNSGFPIYQELLQMATDAIQAEKHLASLPDGETFKRDMVHHILTHHETPSKLQYAYSQRLYYEYLREAELFWAQMDPQINWVTGLGERRTYEVHWAVYDSQTNLPTIYLMELEDTGRTALPKDQRRWPRVQAALMAQSVTALKLLTIARGFDEDFDDIHPTRLRRIHIGPMMSHAFTVQTGPIRDILAEANAPKGRDWCLSWTVEELERESTTSEKTGIFSSAERSVYRFDPTDLGAIERGSTAQRQALIIPFEAYQVLEEKNPANLRGVRKYVVGGNGRILSYR